jgi:aspartyl/asparaginyl beta-hydroxylase (cupin superfamily)
VPEGDCEIVVGGESRRWVEGEVLLFDDSFEHAVHNETDEARLILLIDLWHPELQTDAQRLAVLPHEEQRERYRGVVERGEYETTVLRGH